MNDKMNTKGDAPVPAPQGASGLRGWVEPAVRVTGLDQALGGGSLLFRSGALYAS